MGKDVKAVREWIFPPADSVDGAGYVGASALKQIDDGRTGKIRVLVGTQDGDTVTLCWAKNVVSRGGGEYSCVLLEAPKNSPFKVGQKITVPGYAVVAMKLEKVQKPRAGYLQLVDSVGEKFTAIQKARSIGNAISEGIGFVRLAGFTAGALAVGYAWGFSAGMLAAGGAG